MKMQVRAAILILLMSAIFPSWVYAQETSFTQQDRDRLTRVEEGLKATNQRIEDSTRATNQHMEDLTKATNQRMEDSTRATNQRMEDGFNAINHRLNDLYGFMYVLISGMLTLVGFVLWDRRTTIAPVVRKNIELEERSDKMEKTLKELALNDPNIAEALKHSGL
ncbi:MAG: hypothetical protein HQK97_08340 [Nitrospirae bacterium]|nr:hypothetical protein [Nitrospirota bacterium]